MYRKTALILILLVSSSFAAVHAQWLPGDWKLTGGSYNTHLFSVSRPDAQNVVLFDTLFYESASFDRPWSVERDFKLVPFDKGIGFSSSYKLGRSRMSMNGESRVFESDGVYFSVAIAPKTVINSLYSRIRLPYAEIAGKTFSVDGKHRGDLNLEKPVSVRATSIVLAEGFPGQVAIQLASALPLTIVKNNEAGRDFVSVFVEITGGTKTNAGCPLFLTGRLSSRDLPPQPYCSIVQPLTSETVERYGVFEAAFQFLGLKITNPYDISTHPINAVFEDEFGRKTSLRPIYAVPYYPQIDSEAKKAVPVGRPYFLIRYCPRNAVNHKYRVFLGSAENLYASKTMSFDVKEAAGGFVIRAPQDPRYFILSSGESYFPIGFNTAWLKDSSPSCYDNLFKKMAAKGINATRIWISTWGIRMEDSAEPFGFNQAGMAAMDEIAKSALKYGIKFIFVLLNHEDLLKNANLLPYLKKGSESVSMEDFFALAEPRGVYKYYLRYIVNRYSAFSSIMAFEAGNELDYCQPAESLINWHQDINYEIRSWDSNRHLVTTSLGFNAYDEKFWNTVNVDFTQFHGYTRDIAFATSEEEKSATKMVDSAASKLLRHGLPSLVAEFGYAVTDDNPGFNAIDSQGLHLHNAMWASMSAGFAGSSMNWWWESHILENDLLYHYSALSKFCEGISFADQRFKTDVQRVGSVSVRMLTGRDMRLAWLTADDNTWVSTVASSKEPYFHRGLILSLDGFARGYYRIEWWDTHKGVTVNQFSQYIDAGRVELKIPDFAGDIGLRIFTLRLE